MKAKRKPLDIKKPDDYGITVEKRLKIIKTSSPAERAAGVKVESVQELVNKLKDEAGVF